MGEETPVNVNVFYQTDVPKHLRKTGLFKRAVQAGLRQHARKNIEVNLIFVDEEEILRVNTEFLNHRYVTDVISFNHPAPEISLPEAWAFGDIFVCYGVARERAAEFKHTALQELLMYSIHGALHLSGLDDHSPKDRAYMDKLAEEAIQNLQQ